MSFPKTRKETLEEFISTLIQRGYVERKTSAEVASEIMDALEQEAEQARYHESRMPGDYP